MLWTYLPAHGSQASCSNPVYPPNRGVTLGLMFLVLPNGRYMLISVKELEEKDTHTMLKSQCQAIGLLVNLQKESAWGISCLFKQTNLINPVKVLLVLLLYLRIVPSSLSAGWGKEVLLTNAENKSWFIRNKSNFLTLPTTAHPKFEWSHNNKDSTEMSIFSWQKALDQAH